jgi:serine/threonine-protein kinase
VQASTSERLGGYRVVRRLARGDTSEVLLAVEEGPFGFQREVVLKLLLPRYRHDERMRKLFSREASAYVRLRDPGIVKLLDFSVLEGQLVMVLEYVDGAPLNRALAMLRGVGQNIDDQTAIHIGERLFMALAAAHGARDEAGEPAAMVHRNVSPSNLLIAWDGAVKLSDLGVAKVVGASLESVVGGPKGSDGYMAPEQLAGDALTPKTDVYCAAIVLWELLAGRKAFPKGQPRSLKALAAARAAGTVTRIESLEKVR